MVRGRRARDRRRAHGVRRRRPRHLLRRMPPADPRVRRARHADLRRRRQRGAGDVHAGGLLPHSFGPEHLRVIRSVDRFYDRPMSDRLPYLSAKLQGLGTTIFGEMSALAVATELGQPRPGVPRHRRSTRGARRRDRGDQQRPEPVPAAASACPSLRAGDRRAPAAVLRHAVRRRTPRCSSPAAPARRWPRR